MSDLLPELPRPDAPATWRERLARLAESLDLSPARLLCGLVVLVVGGFAAWRLLAPPALPSEMELPMAASENGGSGGQAGSASTSSATTTPVADEVVVHVAGAVARPGVQRLAGTGRVVDAVDAAGGALPDADLARVNLAAPVEDGVQIYVPRLGEAAPPPPGGADGAGGGDGAAGSASSAPRADAMVNLNTAGVDELDALPGVGPAIAQAIVDHREQNGPFTSVDDLLDVRGIGEAKLEELRDAATV